MLNDIPITIQKSKRIKTLSLSVMPSLEVILKIPYSCSQKMANDFLKNQETWLRTAFLEMKTKQYALNNRLNALQNQILVFNQEESLSKHSLLSLKKALKIYLEQQLPLIAQKMQTSYQGFNIRNNHRVLGSCSYNNRLSFALLIVCAKKEEINYVIIHELAHTIHKNHSKNFWNLVREFCPNYQILRDSLKQNMILYSQLIKRLKA
ncbi:M48 family metallopeptidase [Helicobacter cetorum]|uniref:Putative hydrolase n=1 Tax=Helicobacter cetorum (strain ATCC BAA-429 / MIT 00-7128) TaxID=182217 RepID=I0EMY4_HELC0|nr:M48 family metallopeptidase [Helicobacter cetorum]AFI04303.1 putative hydrolase [Helicobacter cetorum MIT 00-7128]